jgi:hypothetical protein
MRNMPAGNSALKINFTHFFSNQYFKMKKLFVALSHTLTQSQIDGFDGEIVTLQSVNPALSKLTAQVPPKADLEFIKNLAAQVVEEAAKVNATHFCCQGEPTLQIWTNILASGLIFAMPNQKVNGLIGGIGVPNNNVMGKKPMICISSTTERIVDESAPDAQGNVKKDVTFKHIIWRELF